MENNDDEPIDHPALAKYPDSPTALSRVDGAVYRVPLLRDRDEAVPVPVNDLVATRAALYRFRLLLDEGAGSDWDLHILGEVLVAGTSEQPPRTREEVSNYLDGLRGRINGSLPDW